MGPHLIFSFHCVTLSAPTKGDDVKPTANTVSIEQPREPSPLVSANEPDFRVTAVTTARSLLNEAETQAGGLSIPSSPEVRQTSSGYEVRHTYIFPQVANKFHNASSPCDINGDGAVNPLDMLLWSTSKTLTVIKGSTYRHSNRSPDLLDFWIPTTIGFATTPTIAQLSVASTAVKEHANQLQSDACSDSASLDQRGSPERW